MKPKAKINHLREREADQERFEALSDLSRSINRVVRTGKLQVDELDCFVIDQWESEGGK